MITYIILIIIGFACLVGGSTFLVNGASDIAKKFHIPEMLIGLTIVAIGTSAPELMVAIVSAQKGSTNLILGNIIGSNFCNLLLTLGIITMIKAVPMDKEARKIHIPVAFFGTLLLLIMGTNIFESEKCVINSLEGAILITIFLFYFIYPILKEMQTIKEAYKKNKETKANKKIKVSIAIINIIIGAILLKFGGDFVVDNATSLAQMYNISQRIIGLTIVAIGTALPEFITSLVATIKNNTDLAVGNLVGSCIFNMFCIIGVASLITSIKYVPEFNATLLLLAFSILIIWIFNYIGKRDMLNRFQGLILVFIYAIYIFSLLF